MSEENFEKCLVQVRSKEYLLGYIDASIMFKNSIGCERLDISQNGIETQQQQNEILGPVYLDLTCECGNYIAFKNGDEIPGKSFKCSLCEKIWMIKYQIEEK